MKRMILTGILSLAAGLTLAAQQPAAPAQQPAAPAPKGPAPKSQGELDAVKALFAAQSSGPDAIIAAAENLIDKYKDTEFKEIALYFEAVAYQQKRDPIKAQIYAEQVLAINPNNFQANLMDGELITQSVHENDLDKEEKLAKAEKLLNQAVTDVNAAPKPNPQLTDEQWAENKKYVVAEADSDLGLVALDRKQYDKAATQFKAANDLDPQPAYQVRLASALQSQGKNDEAIALCDKLLADPQLHPAIKQVATQVKNTATAAKAKSGK